VKPSLVFHTQRLGSSVRTSIQNIDDILWKEAGCTTELDCTEQIPSLKRVWQPENRVEGFSSLEQRTLVNEGS
jgi:hypothetical protein